MTDQITFLPWLRRGLAQAIESIDPLTGPLTSGANVTAWVEIEGARAEQALRVLGPESVAGLSATQVIREEPRADSTDVEPSYFAFVELAAPDLPWLFTPAGPDGQGRVRPWLVLVVVQEQEGVSVAARQGTTLDVLRIEAPADPAGELPDLDDSWGWAHVQSLVPAGGVEAAVTGATGEVVARLVCPRRLLPQASWLACVVPAFDVGAARGLGEEIPDTTELSPAWTAAGLGDVIELPVYHHWRFSTGPAGTFEELCKRLEPDGDGADLGLYPLEVGSPGLVTPAGGSVLLDMEGALRTPGVVPRPWTAAHRKRFQDEIVKLLDAGPGRAEWTPPARGETYDPATDDPVVAPPLYGVWPAGVTGVPEGGWVRELSTDPVPRAAAGLGARVVCENQEALVAAAWEQAGELRETISALNRGRLAVEVGRCWARRASALGDPDLVQFTGRVNAFLRTGTTTIRARVAASAVPEALVSAAYLRQTRASTTLGRDWRARPRSGAARLGADHTQVNFAATDPGAAEELRASLEFAAFGPPSGAWLTDPTLAAGALRRAPDSELTRELARRVGAEQILVETPPELPPAEPVPAPPWVPSSDVSGIAGAVREVLDPLASVRANVLLRIPALDGLFKAGALPTAVPLGPVFEDPLYRDLARLGTSWILPGVEEIARNRVRLVETNPAYVTELLIGANHELARELLWRGYPVDLQATFFHHFWSYVDSTHDLGELSAWKVDKMIAENLGPAADPQTVVVVRGDLVRRYPTAQYFLQPAALDGDEAEPIEDAPSVEPSFLGALDRQTVFFGFELDPADVRGDRPNGVPGYFFGIEEQAGAPRLGLDEAEEAHFEIPPRNWNALSWGHLVSSREELDALTHARADNERLAGVAFAGATWGWNSAHLARACWQRPFRMYIHADLLI